MKSHDLGRWGEDQALQWYQTQRQARLLVRNFRCRRGEIDLILEEDLVPRGIELVLVEVRARSLGHWSSFPGDLVISKQRKMAAAARAFLAMYVGPATSVRVDLLYWNQGQWNHLPNLWLPNSMK